MSKYNPNRCQCGRAKYSDASACEKCWNAQAGYDERTKSPWACSKCGQTMQTSDSSLCGDCWDAEAVYD